MSQLTHLYICYIYKQKRKQELCIQNKVNFVIKSDFEIKICNILYSTKLLQIYDKWTLHGCKGKLSYKCGRHYLGRIHFKSFYLGRDFPENFTLVPLAYTKMLQPFRKFNQNKPCNHKICTNQDFPPKSARFILKYQSFWFYEEEHHPIGTQSW